jgi:DNA polymerase-3 subunit delta
MARRPAGGRRRPQAPGFRELRQQDLETGKLRPVYVLDGEDQLRIDQVVEALGKLALEPAAAAFNQHILAADEAGWSAVLQQARAYPMLAGRQLVIARHADRLPWSKEAPGVAAVTAYIKEPVESTVLVIVGEQFHGNAGWVRAAKQAGYYFHFAPPGGRDLEAWVERAARKADLDLAPDARALLCELVGSDLRGLLVEIEKLALLQAERGTAPSAAEIPELVMDQAELEVFKITDTLAAGDPAGAMQAWIRLSTWGRDVYELTPLVLWQLRQTALVATALQDGIPPDQMASETGLNPWMIRQKLLPQARRLDADGTRRLLDACLACEQAQKGRPLPPELALEQLLLTAASAGSGDRPRR